MMEMPLHGAKYDSLLIFTVTGFSLKATVNLTPNGFIVITH